MNLQEYFDFFSIISAILWLTIVILMAAWYKSNIANQEIAPYYLPTFYFKLFSAFAFGAIYLFYYQGGDTFAYWEGALKLHNMLYDSPLNFISEMWHESNLNNINQRFNPTTGYPPGWIYREPESFFVSKVLFFFSLITFKSYWATTFLLAYISSRISFSLFEKLRHLKLHKERILAFATLFLPSVSFWCSGISKDTFVFLALMILLREVISYYYLKSSLKFQNVLLIFLSLFLIFQIRIYVLVAIIPALLVAYTRVINVKNKTNQLRRFALKSLFYFLGISSLFLYTRISSGGLDRVFQEIIITQQDFKNNPIYGDNKYTIELNDYSVSSVIRSFPQALIAAIYRPFIWESRNLTLLLNGLEGTALLFLSVQFFFKNFARKLKFIRHSELLIFSVIFIVIMGFSVGFTSGLFGVLVRLKAVILPFFILLVGIHIPPEESDEALIESN